MKGFVPAKPKPPVCMSAAGTTRRRDDLPVHMSQIAVAQWTGDNGKLSYSLFGLSEHGDVFRYDGKCTGWIPWNMAVAKCADDHHK